MICINFQGGALGHMLLMTIYQHWPERFLSRISSDAEKVKYTNHSAMPALFLNNATSISNADIERLKKSNDQTLLLCHNAVLIPKHIQQRINFVNIVCAPDDIIPTAFMFMCKSGDYVFEWARYKQQQQFDFYEIVFQEFVRLAQPQRNWVPGLNIKYADLANYSAIIPVLKLVQKRFNLTDPPNLQAWYNSNYQRSTQPLFEYSDVYQKFSSVLERITACSTTGITYQDTVESIDDFVYIVDFICNLFDKYSYAGENACNEKFDLSVTQLKTQFYK